MFRKIIRRRVSFVTNHNRSYSVRVRFAPSPTGHIHLGGFRTALLNYLFARKHGGQFILRIEDTDQGRAVPDAAAALETDLDWLNLKPHESPLLGGSFGPYTQSERLDIYKTETERLIEEGHAYHCFCSSKRLELLRKDAARRREGMKYDGKCRDLNKSEVKQRIESGESSCIRFKLPPPPHKFNDLVCGPVTLEELQGDFIILKSDGYPTYHLASVVDDHYMNITHVLRGVEWQISTGKHLALYSALNFTPPIFAHLPLILNKDGSKLSKRQGDISIDSYRRRQYYPEALVNFVMGNIHRVETLDQISEKFELESLSNSNTKLDFAYLEQLNQLCLKNYGTPGTMNSRLEVLRNSYPGEREEFYMRLLNWCPNRISKLPDLIKEFPYLASTFEPPKCAEEDHANLVKVVIQDIENQELVNVPYFKNISERNQVSFKTTMYVLRKTLCGVEVGPPVGEIIHLLGNEETLRRLRKAIN